MKNSFWKDLKALFKGIGTFFQIMFFSVGVIILPIAGIQSCNSEPTETFENNPVAIEPITVEPVTIERCESLDLAKVLDIPEITLTSENLSSSLNSTTTLPKLSIEDIHEVQSTMIPSIKFDTSITSVGGALNKSTENIYNNDENKPSKENKKQPDYIATSAPSNNCVIGSNTDTAYSTAVTNSYDQTYTVYITRTGSKYHRYGCGYLRESCIAADYEKIKYTHEPCTKCKP